METYEIQFDDGTHVTANTWRDVMLRILYDDVKCVIVLRDGVPRYAIICR